MRKLYMCTLLLLAGFAGLLIPANAQAQDQIQVKIPFQFVAAGQTFPAGEYRISRLGDKDPSILLLSSRENRGDTVMLRAETEESAETGNAKLNFTTVGDQHVLSRVETGDYAYGLAVPRAEALLTAAPGKGAMASSDSGSN